MVEINKTITLKLIFLISIIALASAFFIEYILGHQPCNLCILERIPYLLALIIIVLNYKFINLEKYFILSLILIFFAATILSLYQLGIITYLISFSSFDLFFLPTSVSELSKTRLRESGLRLAKDKTLSMTDLKTGAADS